MEKTDVERTGGETGGEADVVVAGVVDTDKSVKTDINTSAITQNTPILLALKGF